MKSPSDNKYLPGRRGRHNRKVTEEEKARFIERLCETGNVTEACRTVGIQPQVMYRIRDREGEEEFREAWDLALDEGSDMLEAEARRRAVEGVDRPIYQRGECVGFERQYSDQLLVRLLEAHKPDKYRHRAEQRLVSDPLQDMLDEVDGSSAAPDEGTDQGEGSK
ncbi:hypothetical protein [Thiohalorhabdus sp.]|uniref:hypothetical protein n=1 Tax=Thiohalorhabdus sp. TaxID=3094134 RepID=UPI002FC3BCA2